MARPILLSCFIVCSFLLMSITVQAVEPKALMKQTIDKVMDILKNKDLKAPEKAADRLAELRTVIGERFDYEEMAQRSLAFFWKKRTPEEKKEFVSLFTDLLERSYTDKIESYTDEKIFYTDQKIEGDYATVKTKIITKRNVEVPIEYRLFKKNGEWKVYDVVIEGVSLVNNYRNQFNKIIRQDSYQELVQKMKNKQEEVEFNETR
jgi:phospholipid transport system substrate-binding protein